MSIWKGCRGLDPTPRAEEAHCPRCRASVEIFTRDGHLAANSVCPVCGYVLSAGQQPPQPDAAQ